MSEKKKLYYSDRGHPLIFEGKTDCPVLTVEDYCKWYNLYVVYPNGTTHKVLYDSYKSVQEDESLWADHCFNPKYFLKVANHLGYLMCGNSYREVLQRYRTEILGEEECGCSEDGEEEDSKEEVELKYFTKSSYSRSDNISVQISELKNKVSSLEARLAKLEEETRR